MMEAPGRHFALSGGVPRCRDAAEHTSVCLTPSFLLQKLHLPPEEMLLKYFSGAASFDHFLLSLFSPTANGTLNFLLILTLTLMLTINLPGAESLKVFPLSSLFFLLQPHSILTAMELPTFLSFNPDPKHGGEVQPDLHWKSKKHHQRTVFSSRDRAREWLGLGQL